MGKHAKYLIATNKNSWIPEFITPSKPYLLCNLWGQFFMLTTDVHLELAVNLIGCRYTNGEPWEVLSPNELELEMLTMLHQETNWSLANGYSL